AVLVHAPEEVAGLTCGVGIARVKVVGGHDAGGTRRRRRSVEECERCERQRQRSRRAATQGNTVVVAVAELFVRSGSFVAALTAAVLVSVPFELGFTTMVVVALAPLAMFPRAQLIWRFSGLRVQEPWELDADPNPA